VKSTDADIHAEHGRTYMRVIVSALAVSLASAASAHHSPAMFDLATMVTIEGTVERYEWANPHVYIHLRTSSGAWLVEVGSPSMMRRAGWRSDSLVRGDVVAVDVNPARNAERRIGLGVAVRAQGRPALVARALGSFGTNAAPPVPAESLAGNWLPGPEPVYLQFVGAPTGWSLTPKAIAGLKSVDPENNPGKDCVALQAPFQMAWTDLKSIGLDGRTIVLRSALNVGVERVVHLDTATHDGAPVTNDGHSIGHFENGALVVDTRNFSDHPIGNRDGVPSGAQKHLVERFELSTDRTTLTYRFKLEDPEYLAAPFEDSAVWTHRPDLPYTAEKCDLENARRYLAEP
jgi:hypothetical protein